MKDFKECVIRSHPTGSRYICNPPVMNTDNDTVFLVNGYYNWHDFLINDGWEFCGQNYELGGGFEAFRKGEENYIITEDPDFYSCYVRSTEAAKALNLLNKEDRIKLFEAMRSIDSEGRPQAPVMDPLKINDLFVELDI